VEVTRLPHCGSCVLKKVAFLHFCLLLILGMHGALPTAHPTSSWRGPYLSLVAATTVRSSRSQTTFCCTPNRPALNNATFSRHGPVLFCLH